MTLHLDLNLLQTIHHHGMLHGISYLWGAKPCSQAPFPTDTNQIQHSDCSGWSAYLLRRCGVDWPEGSAEQWEHVKASGYQTVSYALAGVLGGGSRLYVAFIAAVEGKHAGHVWLLRDGWTLECYGGRGVGSRRYDTPVLKREVAACYRLV